MTSENVPNFDLSRIVRRQLHVILALDCSGSMRGDKIASLNYAIRAAIPAIREVASDNPEVEVRMRAIRFATDVSWHIEPPTPVDLVEWADLVAEGETNMGEALGVLAGALSQEALPGRQLPPVLVLVSDGMPSDDIDSGIKSLLNSHYGSRAIRVAIAIGSDADEDVLERFIAHPDLRALRANNAQELVQQIKWSTTMPVKSVSAATTAPDPVSLLARDAELRRPINSDMVW